MVFPIVIPAATAAILLSPPHCPSGSYVTSTSLSTPNPLARAWFLASGLGWADTRNWTAARACNPSERDDPGVPRRRNSHAGLGSQPRQQAISVSLGRSGGADDGSPCCEQFYLLRIRSSTRLLPTNRRRQENAWTIPLATPYRGPQKNPRAFWAYAHSVFLPPHTGASL